MTDLIDLLAYNGIDWSYEYINGSCYICFKYMGKRIKVSKEKVIFLEAYVYITVDFSFYLIEHNETNNYISFYPDKDDLNSHIYIDLDGSTSKKDGKYV